MGFSWLKLHNQAYGARLFRTLSLEWQSMDHSLHKPKIPKLLQPAPSTLATPMRAAKNIATKILDPEIGETEMTLAKLSEDNFPRFFLPESNSS